MTRKDAEEIAANLSENFVTIYELRRDMAVLRALLEDFKEHRCKTVEDCEDRIRIIICNYIDLITVMDETPDDYV